METILKILLTPCVLVVTLFIASVIFWCLGKLYFLCKIDFMSIESLGGGAETPILAGLLYSVLLVFATVVLIGTYLIIDKVVC